MEGQHQRYQQQMAARKDELSAMENQMKNQAIETQIMIAEMQS